MSNTGTEKPEFRTMTIRMPDALYWRIRVAAGFNRCHRTAYVLDILDHETQRFQKFIDGVKKRESAMTDPKPALSTSGQEIAQPQLDILSDAELEMMKTETERHYSEPWPFTHPRQVSMPITQLLKLIRRAHSPAVQALESQWIRVEDKLPELCKDVLIYMPKYSNNPSDCVQVGCLEGHSTFSSEIDCDSDGHVTHWQPRPAPPVESLSKSKAQEE